MLVTVEGFSSAIEKIGAEEYFSFDTETTGLKKYGGDSVFAIIIATMGETYYFNFNRDHRECHAPEGINRFASLFRNPSTTIFLANAKFDLGMLVQYGLDTPACTIHDVLCADRIIYNDQIRINLSTVAKKYGLAKSDAVEEYITKNHLWKWVSIPGKRTRVKEKWFDKVPFEIIQPYGETDARITYEIGMKQIAELKERQLNTETDRMIDMSAWEMESGITKVCYKMECRGIKINERFCREQAEIRGQNYERAAREFHDLTGTKFSDHAKTLGPIFSRMGYVLPKAKKGGDSVTDEFLEKNNTRISKVIQTYRTNAKLANTYYRNYLYFADNGSIIHPDIKQTGTRTGRFSYADPNLQNIPDSEVRKAFIPRPNYCAVSIDFDQQEYRMMLDYAKEMPIIDAILKDGLDVHEATAKMMGVDRNRAKTLNFMLLYGGGVVKLALALFPVTLEERQLWAIWRVENGWSLKDGDAEINSKIAPQDRASNLSLLYEAQALKELYFEKLPKVQKWVQSVKDNITVRAKSGDGYVSTWIGRRLHFNKNFAYKAPNGIIQGGCGDVAKVAMLRLDKFLEDKNTQMVNQIHDELWFEVHETELDIVPEIKSIMENVFPYKYLPLTCTVHHSWENWYDLQKGPPVGKEERNIIQGEGA